MDQYIGKLLDNRYEILELIGVGGMARVYKARCHRLNRLVAVKILRDDLVQDAELRRRFHDESQAVAMLSHPNIVAVYDVSRSSDFEYIVMELIDGITLKQYMQKKGNKLNWREALHFITQIVKALGHAHSRGIIHRDIKPHNIMVLRDGSVKVADFGIARVASGGHSTLTQEALGSVHYISPEQARGSHIDARSDLYSAGVVLYEMITGRLPFEGHPGLGSHPAYQLHPALPPGDRPLHPGGAGGHYHAGHGPQSGQPLPLRRRHAGRPGGVSEKPQHQFGLWPRRPAGRLFGRWRAHSDPQHRPGERCPDRRTAGAGPQQCWAFPRDLLRPPLGGG